MFEFEVADFCNLRVDCWVCLCFELESRVYGLLDGLFDVLN